MAETLKNAKIAAAASDVTSYVTLYEVPAATQAVVSSIRVVNTGASNRLFRMGVMATAGSPVVSNGDFIARDITVEANDVLVDTSGLVLTAGQFVRVSADSTEVTFYMSYVEVTA